MIPLDYQPPPTPRRITVPVLPLTFALLALLSLAWNWFWLTAAWDAVGDINRRWLPDGQYRGWRDARVRLDHRIDLYLVIPVILACTASAAHAVYAAYRAWRSPHASTTSVLLTRFWLLILPFGLHLVFWTNWSEHANKLGLGIDISTPPGWVFAGIYAAPAIVLMLCVFVFSNPHTYAKQ